MFFFLLNKFVYVLDMCKGGEMVLVIGVIVEFDGLRYFIGFNVCKVLEWVVFEVFFWELFEMNGDIDFSL